MHKQHKSERCIQFEFTLFDGPKPQEASDMLDMLDMLVCQVVEDEALKEDVKASH